MARRSSGIARLLLQAFAVLLGSMGSRSGIVLRDIAAEQEGARVREYANIYCSH
jgi:hypothetical protein